MHQSTETGQTSVQRIGKCPQIQTRTVYSMYWMYVFEFLMFENAIKNLYYLLNDFTSGELEDCHYYVSNKSALIE